MRVFLIVTAIVAYLIAAFMFLGAVLGSNELHFITSGVYGCLGTISVIGIGLTKLSR